MMFAIVLVLLLVPGVALADTATSTATLPVIDPNAEGVDVVAQTLSMLLLAFKSRRWMLVAGLVLTIAVVLVRMFNLVKQVPADLVPWATLGIATLASVAVGLQAGRDWDNIVVTGLSVGVAAIGGWETFGKLIRALVKRLRGDPGAPSAPNPPPAGG